MARPPKLLAIYGGPREIDRRYQDRWKPIRSREIIEIVQLARRGVSTMTRGSPVLGLEEGVRRMAGTRRALVVNSGTAALHSAYFAVGVRPGDEVIVPTYTFFASAAPILQCGGVPIFCDIDPRTLVADPDDVEKRITERTRAICVVHVWGNPGHMKRFAQIAERYNVALIEDCSHAHGASFEGKPVGSWGHIGCFSMQGSKAVSGGELGAVVTNDDELYDTMLELGHYGRSGIDRIGSNDPIEGLALGVKYRPHTYGVVLARASLSRLEELNECRRANYARLGQAIAGCPAVSLIESYDTSVRGGLLEFILRYHPEHAGGWNVGAFARAVAAEGVPIAVDRYTRTTPSGRLLHECGLFNSLDLSKYGGALASAEDLHQSSPPVLPAAEHAAETLLTLPPFTKVQHAYIDACGRALEKVAEFAAQPEALLP